MQEADNWTTPGLNNYRQNVQGVGVFNAPDLSVDLSLSLDPCSQGEVELRARVTNLGALGVPMGVPVAFHLGTSASGALVGAASTTIPLLPGQSTTVPLRVEAPDATASYFAAVDPGSEGGTIAECNENNNSDRLDGVECPHVD